LLDLIYDLNTDKDGFFTTVIFPLMLLKVKP
jgi:hypothetical protein